MLFFPNPRFDEELKREGTLDESLKDSAGRARDRAEALAPRIMPARSRSIEVQTSGEGDVLLVNTDHGGHLAEWGSAKNPPMAPLRRAARDVGLRVEESGPN